MRAILLSLILFGIIIRGAYFVATPYSSRGQDTKGHIDYIRYESKNYKIPSASYGWEFHQSPLYYFYNGQLLKLEKAIGIPEIITFFHVQFQSFIFSIFILIIILLISFIAFSKKRLQQAFFIATFTAIPALIILSARITNNSLYTALAYLVMCIFLIWWKSGNMKYWILANILLGIALLTRMSGIVFLPIFAIAPFLQSNKEIKKKIGMIFVSFGVIALLFGWYPMLRLTDAKDAKRSLTFGNIGMNHRMTVGNSLENFLKFNPKDIIQRPYNFDWNDNFSRQYFWEYFYKSAYSSGIIFQLVPQKILTQAMLCLGMILLPFFFWGLIVSLKKQNWLNEPMVLFLFFPLLGNIVYRILFPFSPNQDIRFSLIIFVPIVFFFLVGTESTPKALKYAIYIILSMWIIISAIFFLLLGFNSYFV